MDRDALGDEEDWDIVMRGGRWVGAASVMLGSRKLGEFGCSGGSFIYLADQLLYTF